MRSTKILDPAFIASVSENILSLIPYLHKRLLFADIVHSEHGISLTHVRVLSILSKVEALPITEIATRLGIAKPNIVPLVDRLVEERLVERARDTQDRRIVNVVLLNAGREKLHAIRETINERMSEWLQNLSNSDVRELKESLESLTRILSTVRKD